MLLDRLSKPPNMKKPTGFTLIEVLIALAVLSVGLLASLKITQQSSLDTLSIERRTLAALSAENTLIAVVLNPEMLMLSSSGAYDCPQAGLQMRCRFAAHTTRHPQFRNIEVNVEDDAGRIVASRFGIIRMRSR